MEKANVVPNPVPLPEDFNSSSSKSSFVLSSNSDHNRQQEYRKYYRSKSLSSFSPDAFSPGEVRRIRERLLRINSHLEPSALKYFNRRQKMTLASLALVDLMSFCSMSIMAPFFPKEASEKGLSDTLTGFIFSFYALVMFITSPIFGKILPRVGARFLFLTGIFVAGICNILFGLLDYVENYALFVILCIVIRGFEALGGSAFSTASYVYVVNSFPSNIGSVIGILETFVGLGMSLGPAVGGILYSIGGFSMPFYVLGIAMVITVPLNACLLPSVEDCDNLTNKTTSMFKLIKVPAVVVTGVVVVLVSSTWAFLDPTLEPHLRQFNLSPEKIGLIFLLFSALYGISSPFWGWLADKVNNHWAMMVVGLVMSSVGLLILGPSPFLPFLENSVWLNMVGLSILGISVALALMPTFQRVLISAINGGCKEALSTYSIVAGVWSCMYSLGEVLGPALGGFLLNNFGFPFASTVMAMMSLTLAVIASIFFSCKSSYCQEWETASDSGISESWKSSSIETVSDESTPLLFATTDPGRRTYTEEKLHYYTENRKHECQMDGIDRDQLTDVRRTVSITGKGACEV